MNTADFLAACGAGPRPAAGSQPACRPFDFARRGGLGARRRPRACPTVCFLLFATLAGGQNVQFARVISKRVERTIELPGEFQPFLTVQLHARVAGYVEKVLVDRGSFVTKGQLLVQLSAPEMMAQIA